MDQTNLKWAIYLSRRWIIQQRLQCESQQQQEDRKVKWDLHLCWREPTNMRMKMRRWRKENNIFNCRNISWLKSKTKRINRNWIAFNYSGRMNSKNYDLKEIEHSMRIKIFPINFTKNKQSPCLIRFSTPKTVLHLKMYLPRRSPKYPNLPQI